MAALLHSTRSPGSSRNRFTRAMLPVAPEGFPQKWKLPRIVQPARTRRGWVRGCTVYDGAVW